MLDKKSKETLSNIAFNDRCKPKDRISASKLLLTLGMETQAVCALLHTLVDSSDFPDGMKVKAIELLDKYEIKEVEQIVDNVEDKKRKLLETYNL